MKNSVMHNRKLLNIELGRVSAEEYRTLPDSGIVVVLDNIRSFLEGRDMSGSVYAQRAAANFQS